MCISTYSYVAQLCLAIGANDGKSDTRDRCDMSGFVGSCRVHSCSPAGTSIASNTMERKMKITKLKRRVPAKRKSAVLAKQEHAVPIRSKLIRAHDATFLGVNGTHWTIRVQSGETFYVADNIDLYLMIKNHGPGMIGIPGRYDAIHKLIPGAFWVELVVGGLTIDGMDDKPALVEIGFLSRKS